MSDEQSAAKGTSTGPTRDELFRLLTEEIRDIIETEKIAGWTPWVVLATLASGSWVLVQDLWSGQPRWLAVDTVFVVVTIALHLARFASNVLGWRPTNQRRSGPFFLLHNKASPLGVLLVALWLAATAFACFRLAPTLGWLIFGTAGTVYSFTTLVSLFMTGAVIARVPFPLSGLPSIGRPVIIFIMFLLLTVPQIAAVAVAVRSPVLHSATLVEVRMGAIMALGAYGLLFLSRRLSGDGDSRWALSDIRRDVALHGVSVDEGIHRARIVLHGMGLSDVVTQDMQTLLRFISSVRSEYDEALRKAASLRANMSFPEEKDSAVPELERLALGNLLDVFESHEQRAVQIIARYHRVLAAVHSRLDMVSGVYKAAAVERDLLVREIYTAQAPVDQLQRRFVEEYSALQEMWNLWCPTSPRNHVPFEDEVGRRPAH